MQIRIAKAGGTPPPTAQHGALLDHRFRDSCARRPARAQQHLPGGRQQRAGSTVMRRPARAPSAGALNDTTQSKASRSGSVRASPVSKRRFGHAAGPKCRGGERDHVVRRIDDDDAALRHARGGWRR